MKKYILALDQGTSSSRAILFDKLGNIVSSSQIPLKSFYPQPGWVEQDPLEIWITSLNVIKTVILNTKIPVSEIASIGITNQRETTIIWNKETGVPIYNAIVWQSRQSLDICNDLINKGYQKIIHDKTGLLINPYFSASKIKWILDNVKEARVLANEGKLLFGTVESWLIYQMSNCKVHVSDYSNASRTMLFNINDLSWDKELLDLFEIPYSLMPKICSSSEIIGTFEFNLSNNKKESLLISGVAGDQQAALFGQCCLNKGEIKNTYGTGCFLLMNTGDKAIFSDNGLLTTIAWVLDGKATYALEGSVFIGASLMDWLKNSLGLLHNVKESETIADNLSSNEGVFFIPAFVGLGAPYWDNEARASIVGMTLGTTKNHLIRAALESIAYQSKDIIDLMQTETENKITSLTVDGGAASNAFLMQFQADLLSCEVSLPMIKESTALGAAFLAGLAVKFYKNYDELLKIKKIKRLFTPGKNSENNLKNYQNWQKAIKACQSYKGTI